MESVGAGHIQTGEYVYYRSSTTWVRVTGPRAGPPAQEPGTRNTAPWAFGFEGQRGLTSGVPKDEWRPVSLVTGGHTLSQALGPRVKAVIWQEAEPDLRASVERSPKSAEGRRRLTQGHWSCWQSLSGAPSTWRAPVCCPSSSVSVPRPGTAQQPVGTSAGREASGQVTDWADTAPAARRQTAWRLPAPTAPSRHAARNSPVR